MRLADRHNHDDRASWSSASGLAGSRTRQASSAGSGLPDGGVKLTDNTRLPPHVLREMYAGSASGNRLYGGRMTDQRMQLVTSLTNEALESLHK